MHGVVDLDRVPDFEITECFEKVTEPELDLLIEKTRFNGYKILKARSPKDFLSSIAYMYKSIHVPVWKVVIPKVDKYGCVEGQGAIYYIVRGILKNNSKAIVVFRGTYGYHGTGPYESAFVEKGLKFLGMSIEERDGDYLLTLLDIF